MRLPKYSYADAEAIMWVGATFMFFLALCVGFLWGFLAQMPIVIAMMFWGVFVRRCLCR